MSPPPRDVLRPSLLVRLLGGEGSETRAPYEYDLSVRDLEREVMRNLERILNTRVQTLDGLAGHTEAENSLLTYGLPALSAFTKSDVRRMRQLSEIVRTTIRRFEPRLDPDSVKVRAPDPETGSEQAEKQEFGIARLRIEATLYVAPIREDVVFDTSIDLTAGHVALELKES